MIKYEPIVNNDISIKHETAFPLSIMLKLTQKCNLNCFFCSQNGNNIENMPLELVKTIQNEAAKYGVINISYSGGEPLRYDNIREVISNGYELGINQCLVTNGIGIEKFLKEEICKLSSIGISIHGDEDTHNKAVGSSRAYRRLIESLEYLYKHTTVPVFLNYTINEQNNNIKSFLSVYEIAQKFNFQLNLARINCIGRGIDHHNFNMLNSFLKSAKNKGNFKISNVIANCCISPELSNLSHGCSAGILSLSIESNGDVKICASAKKAYGNIKKNSIYEIWNNPDFSDYRSFDWLPIFCRCCPHLYQCKGGCRAEICKMGGYGTKDAFVYQKKRALINHFMEHRFQLNINNFRVLDSNNIYIIGKPTRRINNETLDIIKILNQSSIGKDFFGKFKDKQRVYIEQLEDLVVSLFKDKYLRLES